jgi:hypothetical protein
MALAPPRQQIVLETTATRDRAEALLRSLLDYKLRSEKNLLRKSGRSALDSAIASTQRMVEALNRVIQQTNRELTDEDLELLDELGD